MSLFSFLRSASTARRTRDEPLDIPIPRRTGVSWAEHGAPLDIPFDLSTCRQPAEQSTNAPLDLPVSGGTARPWSDSKSTPLDLPVENPKQRS